MNPELNFIAPLFEKIEAYSKTSFELVKLKALDKTSEILASIVVYSLVLIVLAFSMLLVNIGISLWLGNLFGNMYYGFFSVAIFYAFVGFIICFFFANWLKKCLNNMFFFLGIKS